MRRGRGCRIRVDDEKGSVRIGDGRGRRMMLKGENRMRIDGKEKIRMDWKELEIVGDEKIRIEGD